MTGRWAIVGILGLNFLVGGLALGMLPSAPSEGRSPRAFLFRPSSFVLRPSPPPTWQLRWVRHEPPLAPAWPDQPRLRFDAAYRPVVAGNLVLLPNPRQDALLALDASTGEVHWTYRTQAPVRFAPAVWSGKAYLAADDGCLHCLDVATGRPLWVFAGRPTPRLVLGNERLISAWPARGAPVVAVDGPEATVYFAAGIWPFMGTFLHALDARTGEVRWTNSGDGSLYIKQPHQTDSFAGGCI